MKLGKSLVLIDHAARVTRGDGTPRGGNVILLAAEDRVAQTIRPRLRAAGADLDRVYVIRSIIDPSGKESWPALRHDVEVIEEQAASLGDVLLIGIDPITAYLAGVDDHKATELRNVLLPLGKMAERLGSAVIAVNHVGKAPVLNAKHRALGSVAYGGTCRANYLFARDPDDSGRVLVMDNGCNLGPPAPTLAYTIEPSPTVGSIPIVRWDGSPVDKTADEVVAAEYAAVRAARHSEPVRDIAKAWLLERLKAGPVPQPDLEQEAKALAISWATVRRAKDDMGIKPTRSGFGKAGVWMWELPSP
jgi:hypothetical protein